MSKCVLLWLNIVFLISCQILLSAEKSGSDTKDLPDTVYAGAWKSGHLQGMAIDDERQYMYFSFTSMLVKTDMAGKVIGTVTGITGHLGDLAFHNNKVYGSLEFKNKDSFYIAIFDISKITEMNQPHNKYGVMTTVYLDEVVKDYVAKVGGNKHRYGCSGVDGIALGTVPGSSSDEIKLMIAYGIYGDKKRDDNDYQVMLQYDVKGFTAKNQQVLDKKNHHTVGAKHEAKYFIYTGNTRYGVQNLEYDKDMGNYWLGVYQGNKPQFPNYAMYKIDGKVAPEKGLIRGQGSDETGLLLQLAKEGTHHKASGVYGFPKVGGNPATGIISLGHDYFYISKSGGKKVDGVNKQYGYAHLFHLDRVTGLFSRVKKMEK